MTDRRSKAELLREISILQFGLKEQKAELDHRIDQVHQGAGRIELLEKAGATLRDTITAVTLQLEQEQEAHREAREAYSRLRQERDGLSIRAREAEKREKDLIERNNQLKDELHGMTVQIARLEGYRDRVLEFDPVTDKQAYQDEVSSLALHDRREHYGAPVREGRLFSTRNYEQFEGLRSTGPAPWYRRR